MRMLKASVLSVCLFTCLTAMAQGVVVKAAPNCGDWLTHQEGAQERELYKSWLMGFLSGFAMGTQKDILGGTSNTSVFFWMDKYCRENPLNGTPQGAMTLIGELKKQKGIK